MASQALGFAVSDVGSVVNGTPKDIVIAVPSGTNKLIVQVAVKYAAVAATTGVAVSFKYSLDGSTYTASGVAGSTIGSVAGVMAVGTYEIGIADLVSRKDPAGILDYEVILTNADATNAASYEVSSVSL